MIVDQSFFRILNCVFDSRQLLRKQRARFAGLDHFNGSSANARQRASDA
jgi:hypothetical protein